MEKKFQIKMPKYPRFARQVVKAIKEFNIIEPTDHVLIPIDVSIESLSLVIWIKKKSSAHHSTYKITLIHFYTTEQPNPNTVEYLTNFTNATSLTYDFCRISAPQDRQELNKRYVEQAIKFGCNKVAIPDSLDFLDATLFANMSFNATAICPNVVQKVRIGNDTPEIDIIRPFCYVTDDEISKYGEMCNMVHAPTGAMIPEDEKLKTARTAISSLLDDSSNIRMNIYHSQFVVNKKFMGAGNGDPFTDQSFLDNEDF